MANKQQSPILPSSAVEGLVPDLDAVDYTWLPYKASKMDTGTGELPLPKAFDTNQDLCTASLASPSTLDYRRS